MDLDGSELLIEDKLYTIRGIIGVGAVGEVYLAKNQKNQKFAIKKIRNYKRKEIQEAVEIEIKLQKTFTDNKYVIQCIGKQVIDGSAYIVFELGEHSLRNRIDMRLMTKMQCLKMLRDLSNGLRQIHKKKIIHRDIKPQNIIYKEDTYKITDFGTSIQNTTDNSIVGTPLYWAPEILFEKTDKFTQKVDVWSLGVLAFECYFGTHPFFYQKDLQNTKKAHNILKNNISKLTPNFTIQKMIEYVRGLGHDSIANYIQMKVRSTIPEMLRLFQNFFNDDPEERDQMDFIYSILQTMPKIGHEKICKSKSFQELPFDLIIFVKSLNLFYQLEDQLPYKKSDEVEKALELSIWIINNYTYTGTEYVQLSKLKDLQKKKTKQYWSDIKKQLFQYYMYLKEPINNVFEKIRQLRFYILICLCWESISKQDSKFCKIITKISQIEIKTLMEMIQQFPIYNEKQISQIQAYILTQIFVFE